MKKFALLPNENTYQETVTRTPNFKWSKQLKNIIQEGKTICISEV